MTTPDPPVQLLRILCRCGAAVSWRRVRRGLAPYCPAGCESSGSERLTVLVDHDASWTV